MLKRTLSYLKNAGLIAGLSFATVSTSTAQVPTYNAMSNQGCACGQSAASAIGGTVLPVLPSGTMTSGFPFGYPGAGSGTVGFGQPISGGTVNSFSGVPVTAVPMVEPSAVLPAGSVPMTPSDLVLGSSAESGSEFGFSELPGEGDSNGLSGQQGFVGGNIGFGGARQGSITGSTGFGVPSLGGGPGFQQQGGAFGGSQNQGFGGQGLGGLGGGFGNQGFGNQGFGTTGTVTSIPTSTTQNNDDDDDNDNDDTDDDSMTDSGMSSAVAGTSATALPAPADDADSLLPGGSGFGSDDDLLDDDSLLDDEDLLDDDLGLLPFSELPEDGFGGGFGQPAFAMPDESDNQDQTGSGFDLGGQNSQSGAGDQGQGQGFGNQGSGLQGGGFGGGNGTTDSGTTTTSTDSSSDDDDDDDDDTDDNNSGSDSDGVVGGTTVNTGESTTTTGTSSGTSDSGTTGGSGFGGDSSTGSTTDSQQTDGQTTTGDNTSSDSGSSSDTGSSDDGFGSNSSSDSGFGNDGTSDSSDGQSGSDGFGGSTTENTSDNQTTTDSSGGFGSDDSDSTTVAGSSNENADTTDDSSEDTSDPEYCPPGAPDGFTGDVELDPTAGTSPAPDTEPNGDEDLNLIDEGPIVEDDTLTGGFDDSFADPDEPVVDIPDALPTDPGDPASQTGVADDSGLTPTDSGDAPVVPEPGSMALLTLGGAVGGALYRRRQRKLATQDEE